jgi:hypothetical protein
MLSCLAAAMLEVAVFANHLRGWTPAEIAHAAKQCLVRLTYDRLCSSSGRSSSHHRCPLVSIVSAHRTVRPVCSKRNGIG